MSSLDPGVAALGPAEHVAAGPRQALTTRFLDFWLLGGASLVVWFAMVGGQNFRDYQAVDRLYETLKTSALPLALLVNYPHFAVSYKLAYSRGRRFVFEHWAALIAVPIGVALLLAAAYVLCDAPLDTVGPLATVRRWLLPLGVNAQLVSGPTVGAVLFTLAFNVMIFTLGWHYTKQVFGCVMVYARYDGYPLTAAQRTLTRYALLSMWMTAFVDNNLSGTWRSFGDFSYSSLDLPDAFGPVATAATLAGLAAVIVRVFWTNYVRTGRLPGVNMLVPFVSIYAWWLPQLRQNDFYFVLVPFFHSLQYLPFAYKMEKTRLDGAPHRELRGLVLAAAVIAAGWLAFQFLPGTFDQWLRTTDVRDVSFFVIAAMLFINIHHYFIDSVVWRFNDDSVRRYLLR